MPLGMPRFWPPDLLACLASGLFSGSDFTDTTRIPRMVIRDAPVERFGSKHSVVGLGFAFGGASSSCFTGGYRMGSICIFSVRLSSSLSGESLSLELNGMSADSWCWVFCPLVFVSLSPLGSCHHRFCLRTSTDPSSLWLSLCFAFGHRRSLLVSAWPLCCGNLDGDSVCLYYYFLFIIICGSTRSRPLSSRLVPSDSSALLPLTGEASGILCLKL